MSDTVKCLSLFAGIGGFEVGMSPCGFRFTNTLEWDENCCITLNANKAATGALEDDIRPIDIMKMNPKDFSQEKIDYIVGGPPCQSFSAAGRRAGGVAGTSDTKRIINKHPELDTFMFVLENRNSATNSTINEMVKSPQLATKDGKIITIVSLYTLYYIAKPIVSDLVLIKLTSSFIAKAPSIKPETKALWLEKIK